MKTSDIQGREIGQRGGKCTRQKKILYFLNFQSGEDDVVVDGF
jgi:hypothetical protein